MANHKSALKRVRQNNKRQLANKTQRTRIKSVTKLVETAITEKSIEKAQENMKLAQKVIANSARKGGVLHRGTASRKISRLSKKVQTLIKAKAA
ncbi:MAG: 30S ribosomal protein S20 [Nitrospiraceae bacterium]|nr:30S ribosomal protein S20 [Nitrospiraceae bacterium]